MPQSLEEHTSADVVKLLLIGPPGTGKTGSLVSLVEAGYNLRILDYDCGLDILRNVLLQKKRQDLLKNVSYESLRDDRGPAGEVIRPKMATAFQKGMRLLDNWPPYGPVSKWTPNDILVIDSLTRLSDAAMNQVLSMNKRLADGPTQNDWGKAQDAVENVLAMLAGNQTQCNVIVMSHVAFIDDANGVPQGYPMSLGKALSPKIGGYFNTCFMTKQIGTGTMSKRVIRTTPDGSVTGIKHTIPGSLPGELPIETGLATFFKAAKSPETTAATAGKPAGSSTPNPASKVA